MKPPPDTTLLATEQVQTQHAHLNRYASLELVRAFAEDQQQAVAAVLGASVQIAAAVDAAVERLRLGGRLIYLGAGTSGRLGVLDGVELIPTFSWPEQRTVTLIAGGPGAMYRAVEGAEDDPELAVHDLSSVQLAAPDVTVILAASGTTPYALGGAAYARRTGALSIGITNNPDSPLSAAVDCPVELPTGPEVISGSTRLKAGTAQKIALNTFSSAVMVRLHKVHGNLMVDLQVTNAKLRQRAIRLTQHVTQQGPESAENLLNAADFEVKTAIVMHFARVGSAEARVRLSEAQGDTEVALQARE